MPSLSRNRIADLAGEETIERIVAKGTPAISPLASPDAGIECPGINPGSFELVGGKVRDRPVADEYNRWAAGKVIEGTGGGKFTSVPPI